MRQLLSPHNLTTTVLALSAGAMLALAACDPVPDASSGKLSAIDVETIENGTATMIAPLPYMPLALDPVQFATLTTSAPALHGLALVGPALSESEIEAARCALYGSGKEVMPQAYTAPCDNVAIAMRRALDSGGSGGVNAALNFAPEPDYAEQRLLAEPGEYGSVDSGRPRDIDDDLDGATEPYVDIGAGDEHVSAGSGAQGSNPGITVALNTPPSASSATPLAPPLLR